MPERCNDERSGYIESRFLYITLFRLYIVLSRLFGYSIVFNHEYLFNYIIFSSSRWSDRGKVTVFFLKLTLDR